MNARPEMEQHLQVPRAIWDRVNWWSVITTVVVSSFLGGIIYSKITSDIGAVKDQILEQKSKIEEMSIKSDESFKDLKDIPYRVQLTEKALDDIRRQFTVTTDRIGDKIDKVLDNQARTDTKVEVVGSQIEDIKKTIGNKIVWRDSPLFPIPLLREISLKPCYLPPREGYTRVRAYYRKQANPNQAFSLANR
jgi:hypothetical protein